MGKITISLVLLALLFTLAAGACNTSLTFYTNGEVDLTVDYVRNKLATASPADLGLYCKGYVGFPLRLNFNDVKNKRIMVAVDDSDCFKVDQATPSEDSTLVQYLMRPTCSGEGLKIGFTVHYDFNGTGFSKREKRFLFLDIVKPNDIDELSARLNECSNTLKSLDEEGGSLARRIEELQEEKIQLNKTWYARFIESEADHRSEQLSLEESMTEQKAAHERAVAAQESKNAATLDESNRRWKTRYEEERQRYADLERTSSEKVAALKTESDSNFEDYYKALIAVVCLLFVIALIIVYFIQVTRRMASEKRDAFIVGFVDATTLDNDIAAYEALRRWESRDERKEYYELVLKEAARMEVEE